MKNIIYRRNTSCRTAPVPAATWAIAVLIISKWSPSQAFQPTLFASTPWLAHPAADISRLLVPATTMRCGPSPWNTDCGGFEHFRRSTGGLQPRRSSTLAARIFTLPKVLKEPELEIKNPEVADIDGSYQLTFSLPAEVEQDGFDVSVSGSLLTVKARVIRESAGDAVGKGGWVTRSSRTESVARSFVLPDDVSSSGVKAVWISDGKQVRVKFNKDPKAMSAANDSSAATLQTTTMSNGRSKVGNKNVSSSGSTQYLSSLSKTKPAADGSTTQGSVGTTPKLEPTAEGSSQSPAAADVVPSPDTERHQSRPRSSFETIDQEISELARTLWETDVLRFPTPQEIAKRAEAAREARARKVLAIRRATMAVTVSETEKGAYLVKIALPEGATRDDVSLAVLPENALRVTFASDGRRTLYKDVRLPNDAMLTGVSAKFESEDAEAERIPAAGRGVSSLQIAVSRAVPSEPKQIEIM